MDPKLNTVNLISETPLVFWDFDGVIKDSVEVKSTAFEALFLSYGHEIAARVRRHHEMNGGMSRFEKIPIYLAWVREPADDIQVNEFCDRFANLVLQAVIDSPWVPGAREILLGQNAQQYFVLVTATPQDEIQKIVEALEILGCFREIHGSPKRKSSVMKDVLSRLNCHPMQTLMIGDAEADLAAAQSNSVPFLLRRTSFNMALQAHYAGPMCDNFLHE